MFFRAVTSQMNFMLKRKGTLVVFYILLTMVLSNFIRNVLAFQGRDLIEMYQPMKLLLLSYNRVNYSADATLLLIQLYPLLVVCPAGFSLAKEYQLGENVYMSARLGYRTYLVSKLVAAFLATAIVFTVPFLLEILLNCISFPLKAMGDLSNWNVYDANYIEGVHNYLMKDLYIRAPYLYAVAGTLFFGMVSGIMGAFTLAFSAVVKVKYTIFLFLPVYLILNATVFFSDKFFEPSLSIRWYDYLLIFNDLPKNIVIISIGLVILVFLSIVFVFSSSRKDCI